MDLILAKFYDLLLIVKDKDMLIDIHTHYSCHENLEQLSFLVGMHSLGIHPWELKAPFDQAEYFLKFTQLKKNFHPLILAIGECGMDRRRESIAPIEFQEMVLQWHLDWALETKRPIVIHCVRAYSDLLKILKEKKYQGKILLHDFSGSQEIAHAFLDFDCYFSFGKRLLSLQSKASRVFISLPIEKLFLETDDQKEVSLISIYDQASELKKCPRSFLESQLEKNLTGFFSDLDNISTSDVIDHLRCSRIS